MKLTYSAYTAQQDGVTHHHEGTIEEAKALAIKYAHESFPAWGYVGYGPKIVVADAETNQRLIEERL